MIKVIVASKNPVKIRAVKKGFSRMFPNGEFQFEGVSVPSHVSDQPLSNEETSKGAHNRAANAQKHTPDADYWVGIEGGIHKTGTDMESFAWIVVHSKEKMGKARTSSFFLPQRVVELIEEGKELGDADDIVFGGTNSKQKNGSVGILTNDVVTRTSYYIEAVILSLIPFVQKDLY